MNKPKNTNNNKKNRNKKFPLNNLPKNSKIIKIPILWILLILFMVWTGYNFFTNSNTQNINTSEGITLIKEGKVKQATITGKSNIVDLTLTSSYKNKGNNVRFYYVKSNEKSIILDIQKAHPIDGYNEVIPTESLLSNLLWSVVPFIVILLIFFFLMNGQANKMMGGKGGNPFTFGKINSKNSKQLYEKKTFKDVAGIDEAVEEIKEISDYLKSPKKFESMGAKIPRGVLLYGPPGTGKTLLAKAVAGEANVPFYLISGSDFVEMFVGVGASRVRDLFEKAKANSPSIIFVDEIDAVARQRGAGLGGGHDEREQTLNQMLVEMDGFNSKNNVILIAATNRPDILDPALLRPGRFDRQIPVVAPDIKGREAILKIHANGKKLANDVDLKMIAKRTPGFTGADLANVLNESALLAARENETSITNRIVDESIDRVLAGPQRKSAVMTPEELRNTAYHEAGHAVVAGSLNYTDPVTKVTIMPRGRALGYTMVLPEKDKVSITRNELLDQLTYAIGGRVAEEIVFHDPTSGASNDIEKMTSIAKKMVTEYGMSSKLGAVKYGTSESEVFLGRDYSAGNKYSEDISAEIDKEIRAIIENSHNEAYHSLTANRKVLDKLVTVLLKKETVLEPEIKEIFKKIKKEPKRKIWLSSHKRQISKLPPVKTVKK